jgi:hypothetical protein
MESAEIGTELNSMLKSDNPSRQRFEELTSILVKDLEIMPLLIDFKYYSEKRLKKLKAEKFRLIKQQDFENAAKARDLEKECQDFINLKNEYQITNSSFAVDDEFITYLYTGNNETDMKILRWYKKLILKHPFDPWEHNGKNR